MHIYAVTAADKGQRLDKYIKRLLPQAPSSVIYKNLRQKNITLNGKKATGNEILRMGDEVRIYFSDETIGLFGGAVHGIRKGDLPGDRERTAPHPQMQRGSRSIMKGKDGRTAQDHAEDPLLHPSGAAHVSGSGSRVSAGGKGAPVRGGAPDHSIERVLEARAAARAINRQFPQTRLIYEDRDIAAAYKPAGLLSQKARPEDVSLNEWFQGTLLMRGEITEESLRMFTPSVQNRLDRGTEGLVLLAKTLQGSHMLTSLQRERALQKYYVMIVCGQIRKGGEIAGWLIKDRESNRVTIYEEERPGAVFSQTVYRPLAWSGDARFTGVEAQLITGRTHQLRAHMSAIGHPILGDPKYGDPALNAAFRGQGVTSQLLICQKVEFPLMEGDFEYLSGKVVEAPLPEIYRNIMQ